MFVMVDFVVQVSPCVGVQRIERDSVESIDALLVLLLKRDCAFRR